MPNEWNVYWKNRNKRCDSLTARETDHVFYIVGEFSLVCFTSMAHAGNTKIWAKIISTRAPNAATKPTTLEKSSYSPQSQKLTLREQLSWRRQCRVIWPNTPHEKTTWRQVQECKGVYLPTDFCRDLEIPSWGQAYFLEKKQSLTFLSRV